MTSTAILTTPDPVVSSRSLLGGKVRNRDNEDLGTIEELMIDFKRGQVAYAVVSFGGFLGMGEKLFAIPWSLMKLNAIEKCFVLDVPREVLKKAPGFDKSDWPNMADLTWGGSVHEYYGQQPYWSVEHGPKPTAR